MFKSSIQYISNIWDYPDILKIVKVITIFKKGNTLKDNSSPIYSLS